MRKDEYARLSKSSRFNVRFMWRMNYLSIIVFAVGLLVYLLRKYL